MEHQLKTNEKETSKLNNFLNSSIATLNKPQPSVWVNFPQCDRPFCTKMAEFVTGGTDGHFGSEHICYQHAKDEKDATRCLCGPAAAAVFI